MNKIETGVQRLPAAPERDVPRARGRIYSSVLDVIGATPLVRVPRIAAEDGLKADLALKLEFFNPLGSVKDRIGPSRSVLVEPTSGNTGIALGFVAAAKGYRLIVTMPEGASIERRKMLRLMGAEVQITPARQGMAGAIARAEAILAATPGAWMPRQFDNPANPAAHEATTAEEIWVDSAGAVDIVVGGAGTGGTMTGVARGLKARKPSVQCFVVEPSESAVLSGDEPGPHGLQGIGPGFHPSVLQLDLMDGILRVSEREGLAAARRCAAVEGLPIGISSGAALHAALELARNPANAGKLIIAIAPSFAERYLSTSLFAGL
jgi:cysteine synthase A